MTDRDRESDDYTLLDSLRASAKQRPGFMPNVRLAESVHEHESPPADPPATPLDPWAQRYTDFGPHDREPATPPGEAATVQRWEYVDVSKPGSYESHYAMRQAADGEWVEYEDYARALAAEREHRLQAERDHTETCRQLRECDAARVAAEGAHVTTMRQLRGYLTATERAEARATAAEGERDRLALRCGELDAQRIGLEQEVNAAEGALAQAVADRDEARLELAARLNVGRCTTDACTGDWERCWCVTCEERRTNGDKERAKLAIDRARAALAAGNATTGGAK